MHYFRHCLKCTSFSLTRNFSWAQDNSDERKSSELAQGNSHTLQGVANNWSKLLVTDSTFALGILQVASKGEL